MSRQEILGETRSTLGTVPVFAQQMSDPTLEQWWAALKGFWMTDTALPAKTKAFLGLSAAAAMRCRY